MAVKNLKSGYNVRVSTKRLDIDRAKAQIVLVIAVASFVTIFSLVEAKAILSQNEYQARVTTAKETANKQLKENISSYNTLVNSYVSWDSNTTNVIGGSSTGSGPNDGSNAQIILDALPPSYDFPALASSLEKILTNQGLQITSISGTDEQLTEQNNSTSPSPQSVSMPFSFSIDNASYTSIQQLFTVLQESIRPIVIDTVDLSGGASDMTLNVTAHTYYQPAKSVNITSKVIK